MMTMIVAKKKFEVATVQLFSLLQLPELALLPGRFFSRQKTRPGVYCMCTCAARFTVVCLCI